MRGSIEIEKVQVVRRRSLVIHFSASEQVQEVFKKRIFEVEYDRDIHTVPESLLVIPFITNVLPIVWVYDATLKVKELDKNFYNHLNDIKKGYEDMYPKVKFGGEVIIETAMHTKLPKPTTTSKTGETSEAALLFSGGVDATSSLVTMLRGDKKPALITLWGADVSLNDEAGWKEKSEHTKKAALLFGLKSFMVKTNFREFIDEGLLDSRVEKRAGDQWWHGFQHGIGILGHVAPLVYRHGFSELYIAASFTRGEVMSCASDPTIDEQVYMAHCRVVHDGYEYSRQDKIANIHDFVNSANIKELPIKVCWISLGAKNCGRCEKCIRTACGFLAEGSDLATYDLENYSAVYARDYIVNRHYFRHTLQWARIQNRLKDNVANLDSETLSKVGWVLDVDFETINNHLLKKVRHYAKALLSGVRRRTPRRVKDAINKIRGKG